jgi:hypothetical protein
MEKSVQGCETILAGARSFSERNSMKYSFCFYFEKTWRRTIAGRDYQVASASVQNNRVQLT